MTNEYKIVVIQAINCPLCKLDQNNLFGIDKGIEKGKNVIFMQLCDFFILITTYHQSYTVLSVDIAVPTLSKTLFTVFSCPGQLNR